LVLGIVATEDLVLEQFDVKTAFLHGDFKEDMYMKQPEGFLEKEKRTWFASWKGVYMALNKLLDNGIKSLTTLCVEIGSWDYKQAIVAIWRISTTPILSYCYKLKKQLSL